MSAFLIYIILPLALLFGGTLIAGRFGLAAAVLWYAFAGPAILALLFR